MTKQRMYCQQDDHAGVNEEELEHYCQMYHRVTLPDPWRYVRNIDAPLDTDTPLPPFTGLRYLGK